MYVCIEGPLPRKTGSQLGGRHLRQLRGGLGRDPVPPLVPSQWGSGNRATVSPCWFDSLWCGPAVPHCARPSGGLLKRCSCSRRELQELKSQTLQGDWAGGRSGRGASWPSPLEWSGGRTQMRRVARGSRGPRKGSGERRPPVGAHGPRLRLGPRYVGPLGPGRAPTHTEPLGEIPQVLKCSCAGGHPWRPCGPGSEGKQKL